MPQNERSFERHERSYMPRNEARRVVCNWATCQEGSTVSESACCSGQSFATSHRMRGCLLAFLRLRIELDCHGIGIDITEKDLNVK